LRLEVRSVDYFFKGQGKILWQFIKFNLVSFTVTLVQLLLANILPLFFDSVTIKLPSFLQLFFNAKALFNGDSIYVVDGVVTYGYVLPFLLSNLLANIYGYFVNMKATFQGKGNRSGFIGYIVILLLLILFSTWLQGVIVSKLDGTSVSIYGRTIAAMVAGTVQMLVLFPLEKYVLFKE